MRKTGTHCRALPRLASAVVDLGRRQQHLRQLMLLLLLLSGVSANAQSNGLHFDGINDYVNIPSPYYTFGNEITVEWWADITGSPLGSGIGQSSANVDNMATDVWLMHSNGNGTITFYVNDNGNWRAAGPVAINTGWHHYAGVANTSGVRLYVDGTLVESSSTGISSGIRNNSASVIHLGKDSRWATGRFLTGRMDEVRIWNRALCQNEIQNNMSCESPSGTGLVEYYKFNQGTAGGTNTGVNTLIDFSGGSRNGSLINFALTGSSSNWVTGNASSTCSSFSIPAITGTASVCVGNATTLANTLSGGTWTSSATGVATVNSSTGVVTGVAAGTATISYTSSCGTVTRVVTVNGYPAVSAITGNTTLSTAITTALASATSGGVWTSANSSVATVNSSTGVVSGVAAGTALISYTVTTSGCSTTVTTSVTVGTPGTGLNTDGANDYLSVTNMLSAATGFTIEYWLKTTQTASAGSQWYSGVGIVDAEVGGFGNDFGTSLLGSKIAFGVGNPDITIQSATSVNTGNWVHVAATWDKSTGAMKLYINGVQEASYTGAGTGFRTYPSAIRIGGMQTGVSYFNGTIDEVRIWNVVRTQSSIQSSMNCDVAQQSGLVAYYRFDQGTAGGSNTGLTTSADYSGNNNCATLNNFALTGSSSNYIAGAVGTCNSITLVQPITGTAVLCAGATTTLSNATTGGSWSSSNASVATVNSSTGAVTGVAAGNATVTYNVCGAIVTTVVTVNPSPSAIGGTAAVCMGSAVTLGNSVPGGSWTVADGSIASVDASGVVTPIAEGTTAVTYTLPEGCFTTRNLTVNPLPASITGITDMCAGNYTTLSSASTGGAWSSADVSVATVNASTGVVTGQFAGGATISYTLPTGCYITTSVNNIVNKITGGSGICQGLTVSLSNATDSGTWSTSDALIADVNFSGIVYAHTEGSATITYTAPDGCYRTHAFGVVSEPAPIVGDMVLCMGETSTLTNASTGGTWSGVAFGVVDGPSGTGVITGIAVGTSTISYSLSSTCRSIVTVTVQAIPSRIMGTEQTCIGTVTSLSTGSTGGAWSSSNTSTATVDASGNVTGVAAGTVDISYAFSSTGCARVATVTVNPNPVISGASTVCVGSTAAFTPSITAGGLSWSSSNNSVASVSSTGVVYGLAAGNATITYTLGSGCIGTAAVTVSSVASISGPSVICAGTPVAYTNATAGGTWSTSNTAVATVNASTGEVTGVAGGVVSIIYTSGSCFASKFVTVNPQPGTINGYPVVCIGLATTLTNASGTWTSSAPSIASVPTISTGRVVGVSAGTAVITFTASSTGCSRTTVVTVQAAPSASTGTTTVCAGLASILSNSTPGGSWSSSHPAVANVDGTGTVTSVSQGTANITYSFGSTCRTVTPFTVRPLPAAISGTATVCMPSATTLGNTTNGGTWSSSNTAVATVGSVVSALNGRVVGVSAGTAEISYTLSATGCSRSTVVTVNAGANAGTITSGTGTYTLRVTTAPTLALTSSGDAGGTWSSNNPSRATVDPSTGVVTAVSSGNVTITYSVTSGCTNYATRYITVLSGREGNSIAETAAAISLYPNPTTGSFTLQTEQPGTLNIFTMDGRELASHEVAAGATQLSMPSEAATGIYMCRFTAADGTSTIVRLVYEN